MSHHHPKLLLELNDDMLNIGAPETLEGTYQLRKGSRVILRNEIGEVAVQYLRAHNFHKLPGGGLEVGETPEEAARREVLEEVGCECVINAQLGIVIEYRAKYNLLMLSYGFVADVQGGFGAPALEAAELEAQQETIWMTPETLLKTLQTDTPTTYESHFNLPRERAFVEAYLSRDLEH